MIDIEQVLQNASRLMLNGEFEEADQILKNGLAVFTERDDTDALLQELVHLYSHSRNRNLTRAQAYMDMREVRQPVAYVALSQAYFQLYIRSDTSAARSWTEKAIERARIEGDWCTLYSACAVAGTVAKSTDDRATVLTALDTMESLIGKEEFISYGDAVIFLEEVVQDHDEVAFRARDLASRIAPLIEDEDYRVRAEAVAGLP